MQPNPQEIEAVTKAEQCAELLFHDLKQAHLIACEKNPLLAHILSGHIATAGKLQSSLAYLTCLLAPEESGVVGASEGQPTVCADLPPPDSTPSRQRL